MNKVYLLLRKNEQKGPYTIDELRQQNLQPSDLIWVEGRSHAWCLPSELEELERYGTLLAPKETETTSSHPNVMAAPDRYSTTAYLERRAEELRKRALSYNPHAGRIHKMPFLVDDEPRIWARPEEDGQLEFVYNNPKKKNLNEVLVHLAAAVFLGAIVALGWYNSGSLIRMKDNAVNAIAAQEEKNQPVTEEIVKSTPETVPQQPLQVEEPAPIVASAVQPASFTPTPVPVRMAVQKAEPDIKQTPAATAVAEPVIAKTEDVRLPEEKPAEIIIPQQKEVTAAAQPTDMEVAEEKRKTIGETLKNLFKKKKREEDKAEASIKSK